MDLKALFAQCKLRGLVHFSGQGHGECFTIEFSEGRVGRGSSIQITQWHDKDLAEAEIHIQYDDGTRAPTHRFQHADFDVVVRDAIKIYDTISEARYGSVAEVEDAT